MRSETDELVSIVNEAGTFDNDVIEQTRELWNYEADREDADVELKIGGQANLKQILTEIERHPHWAIRFFDTTDGRFPVVAIALVHKPFELEGRLWFTSTAEL